MVAPNRFDIYWVNLDPTIGVEIKKRRPCVIISPDEINHHLHTVMVAPITSKGFAFPTRVASRVANKNGFICLDQIRTIDKKRLSQYCGTITPRASQQIINLLQEMFAY